ncbi:MAG: hypothetical protein WCG75_11845 [Armatimonadota bacterium]
MKSSAFINVTNLKILERAILVTGLMTVGLSGFLVLSIAINHFRLTDSKAKLVASQREGLALSQTLEKGKRIQFLPISKKELNIVQAAMDRLANQNNVQLQEVTSTNDTVPFMTHYKKSVEERGWKQLPMTGQVVGTLSNVMAFTRRLATISTPIELLAIDILPIGTKADENSKVSAKLSFQILKQEASQ